MSRYHPGRSYGHGVQRLGHDCYRVSWEVDRYYAGSRLRFANKWDCRFPESSNDT